MPTPQEPDESLGVRRAGRRRTGKVTLGKCLQDLCAYLFNVKLPQRFFSCLGKLLGKKK